MTSASLTGRSILLIEDEPLIAIAVQQDQVRKDVDDWMSRQ